LRAALRVWQWMTMGSVLCVCLGIVLATLSQVAFSLPGFLLVAAACVFSALRWVRRLVVESGLSRPGACRGLTGPPQRAPKARARSPTL
jgi:tetrahydromethanopterin S-methyltransferase subunit C